MILVNAHYSIHDLWKVIHLLHLSHVGKVIREVCDTKLESIGDINAALTVKSELWLAYYGGLARYQIGYY